MVLIRKKIMSYTGHPKCVPVKFFVLQFTLRCNVFCLIVKALSKTASSAKT